MTKEPEAPSPEHISGEPSPPVEPQNKAPIEILLWGILGMVILDILGFTTWVRWRGETPPQVSPLPIVSEVPAFSLTNRDGSTVDRETFLGKPWVADFIFTRCVAVCPRMSQQMRRVIDALGGETPVRFVSFSVDPEHDSPDVLAEYAERFDAPSRWYFLTGERQEIHTLTREGFLLLVDDSPDPESAIGTEPIVHSNRFVLVDQAGRIRSYYDAFDDVELERLIDDLEELLATDGA